MRPGVRPSAGHGGKRSNAWGTARRCVSYPRRMRKRPRSGTIGPCSARIACWAEWSTWRSRGASACCLVLLILDESERLSTLLVVLGLVLGLVQGAARRWRRTRPEAVMAVAVVGGLGTLLLAPDTVLPVAGFFAMWSLAVARPPRVSLLGLLALEALAAVNLLIATVEDPLGNTGFAMAGGRRYLGARRGCAQPARRHPRGGASRRGRGAGPHRPRAARRDRAQRLDDRRAGRRRRRRLRQPARPGTRGAALDRARRAGCAR
jgi:hypothetical protein